MNLYIYGQFSYNVGATSQQVIFFFFFKAFIFCPSEYMLHGLLCKLLLPMCTLCSPWMGTFFFLLCTALISLLGRVLLQAGNRGRYFFFSFVYQVSAYANMIIEKAKFTCTQFKYQFPRRRHKQVQRTLQCFGPLKYNKRKNRKSGKKRTTPRLCRDSVKSRMQLSYACCGNSPKVGAYFYITSCVTSMQSPLTRHATKK